MVSTPRLRTRRARCVPGIQPLDLKTVTSHSERLLVGEIGDIGEDLSTLGVLQGILQGFLALPFQLGSNEVGGLGAVEGLGVLNDLPADQAVLLPCGLDERHVDGHIVLTIEVNVVIVGVHDSSVVRHDGGVKLKKSKGVNRSIWREDEEKGEDEERGAFVCFQNGPAAGPAAY